MIFINVVHAGVIADAKPIKEVIGDVVNFLLYISGAIAILVIVMAGVIYVLSAGNQVSVDKAKKMIIGGVVGLVVVLLSLVIVETIVSFV